MSEYVPTETDISQITDYQDDYNNLLARNNILVNELEVMKKQLKDEIFERDIKIQHLILENEKIKSSLDSANNLLSYFQSQDNSKYKKINEQLSNKNFDLEQINHSLKRDNFTLKSELEEIKIELEKFKKKEALSACDNSIFSTFQSSNKILDTDAFDLGAYTVTEINAYNSIYNNNSKNNVNPSLNQGLLHSNTMKIITDSHESNNNFSCNFQKNNSLNFDKLEVNEDRFMFEEKLSEKDLMDQENILPAKKNSINLGKSEDGFGIANNNNNNNLDESIDSISEEIKNMNQEELKIYIKKIKQEGKEFFKKALEMMTDIELEKEKLKTENQYLRDQNNANIHQNINNIYGKHKPSMSDTANESTDIHAILEEYEGLKREKEEKQIEFESEKNILNQRILDMENNHKSLSYEYENEICRLKMEIQNLEIDKNILEKEVNKDSREKSHLADNLEQYNQIIRKLEDQKDKAETTNKIIIDNLVSEKKKIEKLNLEYTETIQKLEKDLKLIKEKENKKLKELGDNLRTEKQIFERGLAELRYSNDVLIREKELLSKDIEKIQTIYKSAKLQISELINENSKLKESRDEEIKKITSKYEASIEEIEAKANEDIMLLQDKIKDLLLQLEEYGLNTKNSDNPVVLQSLEIISRRSSTVQNINQSSRSNSITNSNNILNNFNFDTLNKEIESLKSKNFKLQVEINQLNNKLKVKENKIANTIRLKSEIDALKKEKSKYKEDMLELKKLFEEQINELLEKLNTVNAELEETKQKVIQKSQAESEKQDSVDKNCIAVYGTETFEELKQTILKLNYEKRFFNDQVNILTKELEQMEKLKNDYIQKLKNDLEETEDVAAKAKLSLAQIEFEKETEIVKYKKYCTRLKTKIDNMMISLPNSTNNSPQKLRFNSQYTATNKNNKEFKLSSCNVPSNPESRKNTNDNYATNAPNEVTKKGFLDRLFNK